MRLYPSYTTTELRAFLETADAATRLKMEAEIVARENGYSKPRVTPQIEGGKIIAKVGRL